jgi:hypothetical protein
MTKEQPEYLSYLLRLWRTEGVGQAAAQRRILPLCQPGGGGCFCTGANGPGVTAGRRAGGGPNPPGDELSDGLAEVVQ